MWSHRPQLDGLRAVAVYLVLLFHCGVAAVSGGFVGVDVFFVLSGFLVTSVMLDEVRRTGSLDLGGFYARRVRRLLPAALLVVVATCVALVLVAGTVRRLEVLPDARAALLYVANWHFLLQSNDYFAQDRAESPFLHFWSLAIEEQFYVVFPVLLLVLVRRGGHRLLWRGAAVLAALSLGAQVFWSLRDPNHAYYGTDARLYQLLAGVLLTVWLLERPRGVRAARVLLPAGVVLLLLSASDLLPVVPGVRGVLACAAAAAVVHGVSVRPDGLVSRALSRPVPVYLGQVSYGTYLWHWPVIVLLRQLLDLSPLELLVVAGVLSTALAALSHVLLETPVRRTPRLRGARWSVVSVGLAASVAVALVVVPPVLESTRRPVVAAAATPTGGLSPEVARLASQPVPAGVDWAALLDDNGDAGTCPADDPEACVVVDAPENAPGGAPRVLLVGDSFANMLAPMFRELAREKGFSLAENVTSGCPWPEDVSVARWTPAVRDACAAARDGWFEEALPQLRPDLVVFVMRPRDAAGGGAANEISSRSGAAYASRADLLWSTMSRTVATVRESGADVTMVRSVVGPRTRLPLDCLSAATTVGQCLVPYPQSRPPSDGYMQAIAAADPGGVSVLDLDPLVCPTMPVCLPVVDDEVVWRDRNHLLTTFAESLRGQVWTQLREIGATQALRPR